MKTHKKCLCHLNPTVDGRKEGLRVTGGLLEPPYPKMAQMPNMTKKFSSIILWDIYFECVKKKI